MALDSFMFEWVAWIKEKPILSFIGVAPCSVYSKHWSILWDACNRCSARLSWVQKWRWCDSHDRTRNSERAFFPHNTLVRWTYHYWLIELLNTPNFSSGEYHRGLWNFWRKSDPELDWKLDIESLRLLQFLISYDASFRQENVLADEPSFHIGSFRWQSVVAVP